MDSGFTNLINMDVYTSQKSLSFPRESLSFPRESLSFPSRVLTNKGRLYTHAGWPMYQFTENLRANKSDGQLISPTLIWPVCTVWNLMAYFQVAGNDIPVVREGETRLQDISSWASSLHLSEWTVSFLNK